MQDDQGQTVTSDSKDDDSKKTYKVLKIVIPSGIAAIIIFLLSFLIINFINDKSKIRDNTLFKINNRTYSIEGLTYNNAKNFLDNHCKKFTAKKLHLIINSNSKYFNLFETGISINKNIIYKKINAAKYSNNIFHYLNQKLSDDSITINFNSYLSLDTNKFNEFINKNFIKYNIKVKNSELKIVCDKLLVTDSQNGQSIDKTKLEKLIISNIKAANYRINIPFITVLPTTTKADFKNVLPIYTLSSFTTYYGSSAYNRKSNINLAASKLNNILLKPNETFEFYKYVGEPTIYRGFKTAPIYINGQVGQGVGGGMCQVSTTLYNAALFANLKIVERMNHMLPVHYIPLGLDATVTYGLYTLKFKNNTNGYLRIKSYYDDSNLTFTIYGSHKLAYKVCVYSVQRYPNSAEAFRELYQNGKKIKSEFLGISTYK